MNRIKTEKRLFLVFVLVPVLLIILMILPLLKVLLAALVLTYIVHPLYRRVKDRTGNPRTASLIVTLLSFTAALLVSLFVFNALRLEALSFYQGVATGTSFLSKPCANPGLWCQISDSWQDMVASPLFEQYAKPGLNQAALSIVSYISRFFLAIPDFLMSIFIVFFAMYFLLSDGEMFFLKAVKLLPIKEANRNRIISTVRNTMSGVIYGTIIISFFQGLVAGIGFYFFGMESPVLLGILTFVTALIPFMGAAAVWLLVSGSLLLQGLVEASDSLLLRGAGLFLYGLLLVSTIDNFLKPKLISDATKLHPLLALIGIIGGLRVFGFVGVIIGPVLMGLMVAVIGIVQREKITIR